MNMDREPLPDGFKVVYKNTHATEAYGFLSREEAEDWIVVNIPGRLWDLYEVVADKKG